MINLIFKNMVIKCNRKSHLIEVSDINGMTIESCKILGNDGYTEMYSQKKLSSWMWPRNL